MADVMFSTGASYHCCNVMLYVTVFLVTLTISEDSYLVCSLPIKETKTVYKNYYQDGDIIIGGLLTVHTRSQDKISPEEPYTSILCFSASYQGYMDALVFSFAIDNINKNPDILPNITLGYHIYDSCLDVRLAVKCALHLLSGPDKVIPNYSCEERTQLAGVIGDHHSSTTIPVAQILGLYGYTQISFGATDYSLTDRRLYPHVFRTVQNNHIHNMVITKLLKHFEWTWVGILVSDDDAGENELQILTNYMRKHEICAAFTIKLIAKIFQFCDKYSSIINNSGVNVIVLCGSHSDHMLTFLDKCDPLFYDKTFVLPPSWASCSIIIELHRPHFNGSLAVEYFLPPIPEVEEFVKNYQNLSSIFYFKEVLPFLDFLSADGCEDHFLLLDTLDDFDASVNFSFPTMSYYLSSGVSSSVYYSVEVMAQALHDMILMYTGSGEDVVWKMTLPPELVLYQLQLPVSLALMYSNKSEALSACEMKAAAERNLLVMSDYSILIRVSLHSVYSHYLKLMKYSYDSVNTLPYFDEYGETVHAYKIINWFYLENSLTVNAHVGNFTPWTGDGQQLHMDSQALTWKNTSHNLGSQITKQLANVYNETSCLYYNEAILDFPIEFHGVPVSRCSDMCPPGYRKMPRLIIHTCCYYCFQCSDGEMSNKTDSENCIKCPSDEWPNERRDQCQPKTIEFISYHNDTIAAVFSFLSVFGCLITSLIFGIFISYRDTPIVKANNQNLSYLLLISIILSFLSVFLFLGCPMNVTCRLRETTFGITFSLAISSLLAKTLMVYVAFKSTKPGNTWRKYLGVKLPYTIVVLASSSQVAICVIWLSISPPFKDLDTQSYPGKIIIQCNEGSIVGFYSVLGYMGLLAAVSFVLAFMVRTLPDTFNEAKYITFSMLVFISVWIAMIPAYLSTKGKYTVAVEIFAVLSSSCGLLGCVFFPKCYTMLFKSEMNTKTALLCKNVK
ncbi:vomeronasal type-2 receptor 26-like [Dendrobates tinctorius]|uniref:vomeronasal type-2 receptor 26-like n=1 Tax=Dendrobates tinctorius TaxID=92724 RepID=UPI003CCA2070